MSDVYTSLSSSERAALKAWAIAKLDMDIQNLGAKLKAYANSGLDFKDERAKSALFEDVCRDIRYIYVLASAEKENARATGTNKWE